jgi:hypothetical protein
VALNYTQPQASVGNVAAPSRLILQNVNVTGSKSFISKIYKNFMPGTEMQFEHQSSGIDGGSDYIEVCMEWQESQINEGR